MWGDAEGRQIARIMLEDVLGVRFEDIVVNKSVDIDGRTQAKLAEIMGRLQKKEPIQYILGKSVFYGRTFDVNPGVLIPRQETEDLVDRIVRKHKQEAPSILDIGTGSGCIAISLALEIPNSRVTAIDHSEKAIETARQNAFKMGAKVRLMQADLFTFDSLPGKYDLMVSNPPYVTEDDKKKMADHVVHYEPASALYVSNDDPMAYYRRIADMASVSLSPQGLVYLEINERFAREVSDVLKGAGFKDIQTMKDLNRRDRFVMATI